MASLLLKDPLNDRVQKTVLFSIQSILQLKLAFHDFSHYSKG